MSLAHARLHHPVSASSGSRCNLQTGFRGSALGFAWNSNTATEAATPCHVVVVVCQRWRTLQVGAPSAADGSSRKDR